MRSAVHLEMRHRSIPEVERLTKELDEFMQRDERFPAHHATNPDQALIAIREILGELPVPHLSDKPPC